MDVTQRPQIFLSTVRLCRCSQHLGLCVYILQPQLGKKPSFSSWAAACALDMPHCHSLLCLPPTGTELSAAITAWQSRHQQAAVLSTGFLDGSHPIVDAYELGVRLQHMLRRLTALAAGANVQV